MLCVLCEVWFEFKEFDKYEVGKILCVVDVFKLGDVIDVVGMIKGKGY